MLYGWQEINEKSRVQPANMNYCVKIAKTGPETKLC